MPVICCNFFQYCGLQAGYSSPLALSTAPAGTLQPCPAQPPLEEHLEPRRSGSCLGVHHLPCHPPKSSYPKSHRGNIYHICISVKRGLDGHRTRQRAPRQWLCNHQTQLFSGQKSQASLPRVCVLCQLHAAQRAAGGLCMSSFAPAVCGTECTRNSVQ